MLRIDCPYCGERDRVEYVYAGAAGGALPELADADIDRWTDWVFLRDNPQGEHREYWQHQYGCRQWLCVVRDTVSHEVKSVMAARDVAQAAPAVRADGAAADPASTGPRYGRPPEGGTTGPGA